MSIVEKNSINYSQYFQNFMFSNPINMKTVNLKIVILQHTKVLFFNSAQHPQLFLLLILKQTASRILNSTFTMIFNYGPIIIMIYNHSNH